MKNVIYSKEDCPFCVEAKRLMAIHSINFEEKKLGTDYSREDLISVIPEDKRKNKLTVPKIWVNGKYIGGCDDLIIWLEECSGGFGDGEF